MGTYKSFVRNGNGTAVAVPAVADDTPKDVATILSEMDGRLNRLFDLVRLAIDTEKVEKIGGWILGRRSTDGQPCLWLYPPRETGLKWVMTTVWFERFGEMPFSVPEGMAQWPSSSAPVKAEAYASGMLNECDFSIVMKHTGQYTETGKPAYAYDRVMVDDEEQAVSVPRPRETPAVPAVDEAAVWRTAVVGSKGPAEAAEAVFHLVPGAAKSPTGSEDFLKRLVGNLPWHGGAALVGAQAWVALKSAEGFDANNWKSALETATAVYAHAAGVMG